MSSEEAHDLGSPEETSAPAETLDTEDRAYDLLFGNNSESETEAEGSAENDVTPEGDDSPAEEETTEVAEDQGDAPDAEATEEESSEEGEDQDGIEIPESFRDITRDNLQTEEGKAVYDALSQAYKAMEADYTRKSQAVAGAEKVLLENEDTIRAIFRQSDVNNPSHSDMLEAAIGESVALRTDADFAKTLYQQLGEALGTSAVAEEPESQTETTGDSKAELEQFKNEVRGELAAREEQEQFERVSNQLQQEWNDVQSNEEFKDFSEEDWKLVLSAWATADEDSSAYAHAKALESRYAAIAEAKAKEAEAKQQEYLKKKAQQPKVGAGSAGQTAAPVTPKPSSWEEADDLASKMLGL